MTRIDSWYPMNHPTPCSMGFCKRPRRYGAITMKSKLCWIVSFVVSRSSLYRILVISLDYFLTEKDNLRIARYTANSLRINDLLRTKRMWENKEKERLATIHFLFFPNDKFFRRTVLCLIILTPDDSRLIGYETMNNMEMERHSLLIGSFLLITVGT